MTQINADGVKDKEWNCLFHWIPVRAVMIYHLR